MRRFRDTNGIQNVLVREVLQGRQRRLALRDAARLTMALDWGPGVSELSSLKSTEDEALLFQEFVDFALQYLEMLSHFLEDNDPRLDHEIVNGLGILVA